MKQNMKMDWSYLFRFHSDVIWAALITILSIYLKQVFFLDFNLNYTLAITIFLAIFSVNFTVFAISNFLVRNYTKIKKQKIKTNIDAVFKGPIKSSIMGTIFSVILSSLNYSGFLIYIVYFLIFYGLISSYYVFLFIYEISVKIKKNDSPN